MLSFLNLGFCLASLLLGAHAQEAKIETVNGKPDPALLNKLRNLYGGAEEARLAPNEVTPLTAADNSSIVTTESAEPVVERAVLEKRLLDPVIDRYPTAFGQDQFTDQDPGYVPCDCLSDYPFEWFVGNTICRPPANTCLFYTKRLSQAAQNYAQLMRGRGVALHTIWEFWDPSKYNMDQVASNPMRCIIQPNIPEPNPNGPYDPAGEPPQRTSYFERMSDAVAYMCEGEVTTMDLNIQPDGSGEITMDGIWGRIEYPRLKLPGGQTNGKDNKYRENGRYLVANQIDLIGPYSSSSGTRGWVDAWWFRGMSNPPDRRSVKRQTCSNNGGYQGANVYDTDRFLVLW